MAITERERLKRFSGEKLHLLIKGKQDQYRSEGIKKNQPEIIKYLAGIINFSPYTIQNWIKGKNQPGDYSIVEALAREFNVEPEYFEDENLLKDTVISMNENNVIVESEDTNLNETSMEQVKLMSGVINDMLDSMKKLQEISGANKNALTSVYRDVSEFLETYRAFEYGTGSIELNEKFKALYGNFKNLRFDVPKNIYDKLEEFITQYLFLIIGIDNVLPAYLKELDERTEDVIEYIYNLRNDTFNNKRTYWIDYSALKVRMLKRNACITDYAEATAKLYCDQEYDVDDTWRQESPNIDDLFEYALLFMKELFGWLEEMFLLGIYRENNVLDNPQLYKNTCINNAYRQLDKILSVYIP